LLSKFTAIIIKIKKTMKKLTFVLAALLVTGVAFAEKKCSKKDGKSCCKSKASTSTCGASSTAAATTAAYSTAAAAPAAAGKACCKKDGATAGKACCKKDAAATTAAAPAAAPAK
jgi:hypothetical protein